METTAANVVPLRKPFGCEICGSRNGETRFQTLNFDYGKGRESVPLEARVPVDHCNDCGEEILADGAEEIRHEVVCRHLGVMTPNEIRYLRRSLGMSREQLSALTGIGVASIARWESGTHIQNAALDRYLRLLPLPKVVDHLNAMVAAGDSTSEPDPQFRCLRVTTSVREAANRFRLR